MELRLPESPSTGYRWAVEALDETYVAIGETGFRGRADVGGGGEAYWRWRAIGAGQTAIGLKRWRPFEGDRSIVERFAVTLRITR